MTITNGLGLCLVTLVLAGASTGNVLTPRQMLSAPRPHPAIANPNGTVAISAVDQWDSDQDRTTRSIHLISLTNDTSSRPLFTCPPGEASELFWLDDESFAYINDTSLYSASLGHPKNASALLNFPAGVNAGGLQYNRHTGYLAFSAQVWQDGDLEAVAHHDKEYEARGTTGVVYDDLFVRHWDTWRTPGKVWTIGLTKLDRGNDGKSASSNKHHFRNALNGTGLISPMDPVGSISLSSTHLAFSLKARHLNLATHTREDVYLVPYTSSLAAASPTHVTPSDHGVITDVKFSPNGKRVAWLQMAEDGYESDKRVVLVYDVARGKTERWTDDWDRSPSSIEWSLDSRSIFAIAENEGYVLPYQLVGPTASPSPLLEHGATSAISQYTHDRLLLSMSSLTSPADDFTLALPLPKSAAIAAKPQQLTDWSAHHLNGTLSGITREKIWFKGADDWDVMAWAIKPAGWNETDVKSGKKYPLAFFVHGGPQGSWEDAWSTRWNPALFASNGYFVIAVNPTGSTGYGQEFCDRIKGQWGGRPFKDLLAGYQYALKHYPEIDPQRTAMLGASYGGFMANWIQGHNDQFGFKAIVCHDGIFDTTDAFYTTEEVWFPQREFGGDPTQTRLLYEKWNPMNHVAEWKTPELVIHGGKDYRLVDGQGIAAFTALQYQGVPSRFLYFPDENHWVLTPKNSLKWHHEVFRWLEEWVGEKDKKQMDRPALVVQSR